MLAQPRLINESGLHFNNAKEVEKWKRISS